MELPHGSLKRLVAALFVAAGIGIAPLPATSQGEESGDGGEIAVLEESVVTATRTETDILEAPAAVTVITGSEIEKSGANDLAELLAGRTSATIRDYGPEGSLKSVSIRGSSSEGVLVLIDGVRMNDARAGGVDLSLIPLHSIERIEIVRGGTSALYGADAVGGIINIITKREADDVFKVSLENGSYIPHDAVEVYEGGVEKSVDAAAGDLFDSQKAVILFSRKFGGTNLVASGSFTRANNGYTWYDSDYAGEYRKQVNADMLGGDLYTSVAFPLFSGRFDATGQFSYADKGAPGPADPSAFGFSTVASERDAFALAALGYASDTFISDALTIDLKGSYRYSGLDFEDPNPSFPQDDTHRTHSVILDATQSASPFARLSLVYGFNLGYDFVNSTQIGEENRFSGGLFLEAPLYLGDRFTLAPVVRYDFTSDFPDTVNYKLGAVYTLSPSASLKASFSKSYRAPTLNDLYWPNAGGVSGNPDLEPEKGYTLDAGVVSAGRRLFLDCFVFARYMIDEIKWAPDSGGTWTPTNLGRSFYPGLEANARLNLAKGLWLDASSALVYSFLLETTSAEYDLEDGKRVPLVPPFTMDAGLEYDGSKNRFRLEGQFTSKYYTDPDNTSYVDGYFVMNAGYTRKVSKSFSFSLYADNLLDATYETVEGYIMPPFRIRTVLEAEF